MLELALAAALVQAPAGTLLGTVDRGMQTFRGIPYARAPIGPLRWRAPQPLPRWRGIRDADRFGAMCMQPDPAGDVGTGKEPQSEDCLTLNIWAPPAGRARRPVMVWLHGGGYTGGSGSAALYDGAALARRGVVVVTLNYRLGRFGFFAHPQLELQGEGSNFALLDQAAALRWVRGNIAAFGGDPARVTLFGNSAGGESVLAHMVMPRSRGLFTRAIVQSGFGSRSLPTASASTDAARASVPLAALRALPAREILAWGKPSMYEGFGPVRDGVTLTQDIEASFRAGRQARIPLLIGWNSLEFPLGMIGGPTGARRLAGQSPERVAAGIAAYGDTLSYDDRIASDVLFRAPALRLARHHAAHGAPTFVYAFDVVSPAMAGRLKGAPHASERPYVFGNLGALGWPIDARDAQVARELGDRWVAFAQEGAPTGGSVAWRRADKDTPVPMIFSHGRAIHERPLTPALRRFHGLP